MSDDDIDRAMAEAVARYSGAVTQCPPGKKPKRGWSKPRPSKTVKERPPDPRADAGWQDDGPDLKAERKQRRMARVRREQIGERNAPMLKRIAKQDRVAQKLERIVEQDRAAQIGRKQ